MLNRAMLSTVSLTVLTVVVNCAPSAIAMRRPLSGSSQASIQLSNSFASDPFVDPASDDLSGLMITGCSQFGSAGPQVCLQWLGDALTTCLEWGDESVVTACMQKGNPSNEDVEEGYAASSASSNPSRTDWGFSVEFTLQ